ncbi:acyl-CoA dehydrogenase family protein [Parapusillimonas granuli]|uniref:Acyl-CoA/acyl-ACP dehydrogenase n=1 Tax=Parapusillimonas granuli TaxID=380911 RepID=A0A853FWV6_9BURK|nr:acyl-CoA dehydrogenase family protein [Parapusillimonas granuli]MBB5216532.1 alkylation response protein AidB-like acyl-CoA dehydrogenase [Parapusillimonas granuli]NYT48162.1 acyl-CoA/acyl-ACP dehydrogenase [Parapusillimonas granuli]
MAFEPAVVFPGVLFDGAERYAKDVSAATPASSIIQEMGWGGTLIPEAEGGYGGRFNDLGSLIEGMAARAVNLPVMTRCGIVPAMLGAAPANAAVERLRAQIAAGEACVEFAGPLSRRESGTAPTLSSAAGAPVLAGSLEPVELTDECTHILFNAVDAATEEALVILLDAQALGGRTASYVTVEGRSVRRLDLNGCTPAGVGILARGAAATAMQSAGWRIAQAAVAADIVCTMNYALAETLRYLQERKQFGQALAQFQVLRHDAAKLYVTFESCKCLLMSSLRSLDGAKGAAESAAAFDLLGLYVREQAIEFAQAVIQLHGGMGMTRETLAARMATRLIALAFRYGDACSHVKALGEFQGAAGQ